MAGAYPGRSIEQFQKLAAEIKTWLHYAKQMTRAESLEILEFGQRPPGGTVTGLLGWCQVLLEAPQDFDFERARASLFKEFEEVSHHLNQHVSRTQNPDFLQKASIETQQRTVEKVIELASRKEQLEKELHLLGRAD
jgi:valyl-tRNA synthetase